MDHALIDMIVVLVAPANRPTLSGYESAFRVCRLAERHVDD